jgi:hypothetical protein
MWIAVTREEDDNLQHNNVCFGGREKVGTKYGDIILRFWKYGKVQNLHEESIEKHQTYYTKIIEKNGNGTIKDGNGIIL